jgi:hypothetical protein
MFNVRIFNLYMFRTLRPILIAWQPTLPTVDPSNASVRYVSIYHQRGDFWYWVGQVAKNMRFTSNRLSPALIELKWRKVLNSPCAGLSADAIGPRNSFRDFIRSIENMENGNILHPFLLTPIIVPSFSRWVSANPLLHPCPQAVLARGSPHLPGVGAEPRRGLQGPYEAGGGSGCDAHPDWLQVSFRLLQSTHVNQSGNDLEKCKGLENESIGLEDQWGCAWNQLFQIWMTVPGKEITSGSDAFRRHGYSLLIQGKCQ